MAVAEAVRRAVAAAQAGDAAAVRSLIDRPLTAELLVPAEDFETATDDEPAQFVRLLA